MFAYAPVSHLNGFFNSKTKTWDLTSGAGEELFNVAGANGQVIMIDYTCTGKTMLQVTTPDGGANMQNMCSIEADNSLVIFGATQKGIDADFNGINTYGFSTKCDPKFLGQTNEQLAPHSQEYIMTISSSFIPAIVNNGTYSTFDPKCGCVICTNGQPLLSNSANFNNPGSGIFSGLQIPTTEMVTVEEKAPKEGTVSYTGPYMVSNNAVKKGRRIIAYNGTVSIKKIFFSY